jgi:hypothetical protein
VSAAPATSGGASDTPNLRPGPERSGIRAARAFMAVVSSPVSTAATAATDQVASHVAADACSEASHAASSAVIPITITPHPDTAVKLPARSIVSRM